MDEEVELRRRAVELVGRGGKPSAVAEELGRSREWVRKWLHRYKVDGEAGLADRSHRSSTSFRCLPNETAEEVLSVRELLDADRFANSGPGAIAAEIERRGILEQVPSLSSIKRVLTDAGLTRPYRKLRRSNRSVLGLPKVTLPGIWQQADWIQDRALSGGIRFSSLQIGDVGSHMMSAGQHRQRTLLAAVSQLTERAWPAMSIPLAMGTDNAFSKTTHRNNPWTVWIKVLLMFGVEPIVSPANSLGFTNHIEAVNWLWQDRTINRYRYDSLDHLTSDNAGFLEWANNRRAILDPTLCGTRYPAAYVTAHTSTLRWLPAGFSIGDYLDAKKTPRLPLTRGKVTFLRYVNPGHTIEIGNTPWPVPPTLPTGVLVVAAINTDTARLELRHRGELLNLHNYPIAPATIDPYHPPSSTGLLDHLPTIPRAS